MIRLNSSYVKCDIDREPRLRLGVETIYARTNDIIMKLSVNFMKIFLTRNSTHFDILGDNLAT